MTTFLPPPPEPPGNKAIPSSPTSRLRSVDVRIWLLIFAAVSLFFYTNQLFFSIAYYGLSSQITFYLLVFMGHDLILLHAALTNETFSLKFTKAVSFLMWSVSLLCFFLLLAASTAIIFGFSESKKHLFDTPDKTPTYGEQVWEALLVTSIIGVYCFIMSVRFNLVKNTLKKVQMEKNLERNQEQLPIRTV